MRLLAPPQQGIVALTTHVLGFFIRKCKQDPAMSYMTASSKSERNSKSLAVGVGDDFSDADRAHFVEDLSAAFRRATVRG